MRRSFAFIVAIATLAGCTKVGTQGAGGAPGGGTRHAWTQPDTLRIGIQDNPNTLSPLIKRLETIELVVRRRRSDDERAVDVQLTRQGKAMQRRAAGVSAQVCTAAGLDAAGRARLVRKLRKLTQDLEGAGNR